MAKFQKGVSGNPAGRPVGSKNIYSQKSVQKLMDMGVDPLEYLASIIADPSAKESDRIKCAEKLIDFAYSKQPSKVETKIEGSIPIMNVRSMAFKDDKIIDGDPPEEV